MQCQYCKKGIGPLRLLRDPEFCSEAHRTKFRERYRQQALEALAPEPDPVRMAGFLEQTPATGGPVPSAMLCVRPKSLPDPYLPAMNVAAAGISGAQPGWILGQNVAAKPTRLVWHDSTAAFPSPIRTASFSIGIQPPYSSAAGAAPTHLVDRNSTTRPATAAPRISEPGRSLPDSVSLPKAAQIPAPVQAEPFSPQLQATRPLHGDPAATGPVARTIRAAVALPCSTTIAGPKAPARSESAPEVNLSAAVIASQPRPLEAWPRLMHSDLKTTLDQGAPVALEAPGARAIGIILPKPPAPLASSTWIGAAQHAQPFQPQPRMSVAAQAAMLPAASVAAGTGPLMPGIAVAPPAGEQIASVINRPVALAAMAATSEPQRAGLPAVSPSWHAARSEESGNLLGLLGSRVSPRVESPAAPIGAIAGLVQPGSSPLQEASGNRIPRSAVSAAPARTEKPATPRELLALHAAMLGEIGSAPPRQAQAPAPAAPPAAAPSWDAAWRAASAVSQEHPLVGLADITLVRICGLSPGALAGSVLPLRQRDAGRPVRACAVLWTLRVAHMCNPAFRMEPVRARFNDLVRADRNLRFGHDLEDRPAKTNLRLFKRDDTGRSSKLKWQFIGAAAAALLLAGTLGPQMALKGFGGSLRGISVRQWMSKRATRTFADDFRAGLNQWKGVQANLPKSWSYSADGFVHPGKLALYRPSAPLADYRMEFLAQIETKSVDWVVRAKDANNYYAMKFTILQPGPRPLVAMVHYPVIGGHQEAHVQTPLRMMIHANTPYRVSVEVKGNQYRAYVEDQEADFWTDDRLKTGGVGLFSEAGESARVYWVKIESHGDILGRVCGLLSGKSSEGATDNQAMDYRHAGTAYTNTAFGPGGAEAGEARISRVLLNAPSPNMDGKLDEGVELHPALFPAPGQWQYELRGRRERSRLPGEDREPRRHIG